MAWDGAVWVKLNRPLTDDEKARQLKVTQVQSNTPADNFSVFSVNDVFLESTDVSFHQRGMTTWGCLAIVVIGAMMAYSTFGNLLFTPPNVGGTELAVGRFFMGVFCLWGIALVLIGLWGISKEMFTWTRFPVRFNRQSRMVYAFRGAGTKRVVSVPWDKAFFFVQPGRDVLTRAYTYSIRCHVLDDAQQVLQSFSVGNRVVTMHGDETEPGARMADKLKAEFEYIRQYMERGFAGLPYPELVPSTVSFANSMRLWSRERKRLMVEGNAVASFVALLLIPVGLLFAVMHYVGQRTSREPHWPQDVELDCNVPSTAEPARV